MPPVPVIPEILAPVGSPEAFEAALASGADAVYLGLAEGFQARARSTAFELAGLPALCARAHAAGVKLYLTLNTLVFESELTRVESLLREVIAAGVDALIVQDPAVALLARELCPELSLHGSTQMTISSAEGGRFALGLGISRVVLPRELHLREIARFAETSPLETEVFVHGALCMAWSGQCLTSEALSQRSANRGQCSQACRMPYDLIVDGERRDLGDTRYLLSPQDLAAAEVLPELMAAGVHGLKVEGRYKNAAYVLAAVTALRHQRAAVSGEAAAADQLQRDLTRSRLTFSRGASLGFLRGDDHQTLVQGRTPKHRGILLGRVLEARGRRVGIAVSDEPAFRVPLVSEAGPDTSHAAHGGRPLAAPAWPRAGMGVMFDVGDPERDDAPGGAIFELRWLDAAASQLELSFGPHGPDLSRVHAGVEVYLTGDPELQREAERVVAAAEILPRLAVRLEVCGCAGEPLSITAAASFGGRSLSAAVASRSPLVPARAGGLDEPLLRAKLDAFGGTPFRLETLDLSALAPGLYLPVSELKPLRRELVATLLAELTRVPLTLRSPDPQLPVLQQRLGAQLTAAESPARIVPLCRTMEQLEAVIALGIEPGDEVELDFMEFVGLSKAVASAREAGLSVTIATVRVQKPGEETFDRRIAALAPNAVLVRHWGALMHFAEPVADRQRVAAVHGDFSLNVTNSLTARHILSLGLATVTASHDLDRAQLLALLAGVPRGRVAITLHHHMPTFHNSHCVYAHLLSDGADYRSCGRPCEEHRVALRDFAGHDHPVLVDVSCRNTVFNARAQSAAPLLPELLALGVRLLRVEFVWERAHEVVNTLQAYRAQLRGELSPAAAIRRVGVHEQYGVASLRGARALPITP